MPKAPFKESKELEAFKELINLIYDPVTGQPKPEGNACFNLDTNIYVNVSAEFKKICSEAYEIEQSNYDKGIKDTTHLPFIKKSTQLLQRVMDSSTPGKNFTAYEIEKIAASFEDEATVNKKLRIAGAVLVGMLVIAALAAIAVATFGLATTPFIGAGFAAFSTFMAAAGAKMLATLTAITGSALGISIVTGSAVTLGLTSVIAGLGAKIAGDAKQKRLDDLMLRSNFGNSVVTLFGALRAAPAAPPAAPVIEPAPTMVLGN